MDDLVELLPHLPAFRPPQLLDLAAGVLMGHKLLPPSLTSLDLRYIIKSRVDDACLRLKMNTLQIQDELVILHNQHITLQN
jgi:hypothetical protein